MSAPLPTITSATTDRDGRSLGQVAFEAHRDYLDGNRPWSELRPPERDVWEETGRAVAAVERLACARQGFCPAADDHRHCEHWAETGACHRCDLEPAPGPEQAARRRQG